LEEVKNLPIARRGGNQIDLRNVVGVTDGTVLGEYDRYNMQRMLTLSANIAGEALRSAAARVQQSISDTGKPPNRVNVTVRGQIQPMAEMFGGLRLGLLMAVGVIFLLRLSRYCRARSSAAAWSWRLRHIASHARSRSFSALAKSIYFSRCLGKHSGARLQDRKKTFA
jgi:multidrug efflux pump subunit AcrB